MLRELRQRRAKLVDEAKGLLSKADEEKRSLSAEERARFDTIETEVKSLDDDIATRERVRTLEERSTGDPRERVGDPLPHQVTNHPYSLRKAIAAIAGIKGYKLDGLELETSEEIALRKGKNPQGFFMPIDLPVDVSEKRARARQHRQHRLAERRALNTTTGTGAIETIYADTWIELLRARMVLNQAGARYLTDLQGSFAMPRQNAAATISWVAEGTAVTGSNQTLDQVLFAPKTAGVFTDMTRRFLEQASIDAEEFLRQDLANIMARGVEGAAFTGTGSGSNQPLGLTQNGSIPVVALGTNGAAPTWQSMVQLETQLAAANADMGQMSYIMSAKGRSTLKQTLRVSGSTFPIYLWDEGRVNEYPAFVTNLIPDTFSKGTGSNLAAVIFGNWEELIFGFWTGVDVLIDPYTGGAAGTIRVVMLQDLDIEVRHTQSFAQILDMITQ